MKLVKVGATKALLGWPVYSTWNGLVYASTDLGWMARVKTFLGFVPLLFITAMVWTILWAMVVWPLALITL